MAKFSISLPDSLTDQLDKQVALHNCGRSKVIQDALSTFLDSSSPRSESASAASTPAPPAGEGSWHKTAKAQQVQLEKLTQQLDSIRDAVAQFTGATVAEKSTPAAAKNGSKVEAAVAELEAAVAPIKEKARPGRRPGSKNKVHPAAVAAPAPKAGGKRAAKAEAKAAVKTASRAAKATAKPEPKAQAKPEAKVEAKPAPKTRGRKPKALSAPAPEPAPVAVAAPRPKGRPPAAGKVAKAASVKASTAKASLTEAPRIRQKPGPKAKNATAKAAEATPAAAAPADPRWSVTPKAKSKK